MNLYLISQGEETGYHAFLTAVVAAESEEAARYIHPATYEQHDSSGDAKERYRIDSEGNTQVRFMASFAPVRYGAWEPDDLYWCRHVSAVTVRYIGKAAEGIEAGTVLCAEYKDG